MAVIKRFGWRPDKPDFRDHKSLVRVPPSLPEAVDLRAQFPAVYEQGDCGSCTANAIAGAMEFDQIKEQLGYEFTPSRLFIYYNERDIEGDTAGDDGAEIRDGIKAVNTWGACPESDWPYDPAKYAVRPSSLAYRDANLHKALAYAQVDVAPLQCKAVLAAGFPIVFGFSVYDSFMTEEVAATGIMVMPNATDTVQGGHAVVLAGYSNVPWTDKLTGLALPPGFIVRNSWSDAWGIKGYFVMPFDYVNPDLADDFWQITVVK
jgi:C1A family cysteine protease